MPTSWQERPARHPPCLPLELELLARIARATDTRWYIDATRSVLNVPPASVAELKAWACWSIHDLQQYPELLAQYFDRAGPQGKQAE